jgi:hypothetical protein
MLRENLVARRSCIDHSPRIQRPSKPVAHSEEALKLFSAALAYFDEADRLFDEYNGVEKLLWRLGYRLPTIMADYHCVGVDGIMGFSKRDTLIDLFSVGPVAGVVEISKRYTEKRVSHQKALVFIGEYHHWVCVYCQRRGTPKKGPDGRTWHIDHGYPKILGGDDDPDNLILACATCNLSKNKKTVMEVLRRTLAAMEAADAGR